jgi:hypothetical protein
MPHPQIVAAAANRAPLGTAFPAPGLLGAELAERIVERVKLVDQSGSRTREAKRC